MNQRQPEHAEEKGEVSQDDPLGFPPLMPLASMWQGPGPSVCVLSHREILHRARGPCQGLCLFLCSETKKEKTRGMTRETGTGTSKVPSLSSGFPCGLWLRSMA